jgi:hypothetical protein
VVAAAIIIVIIIMVVVVVVVVNEGLNIGANITSEGLKALIRL